MDLLDAVVAALVICAAVGGYRLGFLARAASWIGLAAGLFVAARVLPSLLRSTDFANPSSRLLLTVGMLILGAVVGQVLGLVVGARLHEILPMGPLREADRGVGAAAGAVGVLALFWLLVPTLASVPGWPSRAASGSSIARWVSTDLPPPPDTFAELRRLVGENDFPQVFADLGDGGNPGSPPASNPVPASVTAAVSRSTVKVEGQACDRVQSGSGFVVAPGLIATNAHVVAGEPAGQTEVITYSGQTLPASVVAFDANRDIALLSAPGDTAPPLTLGTPTVGHSGVVLGHPEGQAALAVQPARIASEIQAVGGNLYGTGTTKRDVLVLAAALEPGDSGGALVATSGVVVGVAFAISQNNPNEAYALASDELAAVIASPHAATVSTGGCLDS